MLAEATDPHRGEGPSWRFLDELVAAANQWKLIMIYPLSLAAACNMGPGGDGELGWARPHIVRPDGMSIFKAVSQHPGLPADMLGLVAGRPRCCASGSLIHFPSRSALVTFPTYLLFATDDDDCTRGARALSFLLSGFAASPCRLACETSR